MCLDDVMDNMHSQSESVNGGIGVVGTIEFVEHPFDLFRCHPDTLVGHHQAVTAIGHSSVYANKPPPQEKISQHC